MSETCPPWCTGDTATHDEGTPSHETEVSSAGGAFTYARQFGTEPAEVRVFAVLGNKDSIGDQFTPRQLRVMAAIIESLRTVKDRSAFAKALRDNAELTEAVKAELTEATVKEVT
jgi:hypothetical protein